jgi:low affinity Fe/Cu permease
MSGVFMVYPFVQNNKNENVSNWKKISAKQNYEIMSAPQAKRNIITIKLLLEAVILMDGCK